MPTLVEKLQLDAMDPKVGVGDLLRRVKLTAVKLGLSEVEEWVEHELNGYEGHPVPPYRTVGGRPVVRNPFHGWMPLGGQVGPLSKMANGEPVSALEELMARSKEGGTLHIPYSDAISAELDKVNGVEGWNYALQVPPSELSRILDRVRTLVLDWALALERAGIIGSELNFDAGDKAKARAAATTINIGSIGNFAGNLGHGNVSGDASININTDDVKNVIEQLKAHVAELVAAGAHTSLSDRLQVIEKLLRKASQANPDFAACSTMCATASPAPRVISSHPARSMRST